MWTGWKEIGEKWKEQIREKITTGVEQELAGAGGGGVRLADWQVNQAKMMLWNALTDYLSLN